MKKAVVVFSILLAMLGSVLSGTLASYTITLPDVASGSTVAKEFVFLEDGEDTFRENVRIAPSETVIWQCAVKNFDGIVITETDMYYDIVFNIGAIPGGEPIEPLIVTVKDENGNILGRNQGIGEIEVTGSFPLSPNGQSDSFTVEIYWPRNDLIDQNYMDFGFGTAVNIAAAASQVPIGTPDPGNYSGELPPELNEVDVLFETSNTLFGLYRFEVTITNNTDKKITNWDILFKLNQTILSYSDAVKKNAPAGYYKFEHPQNYNKHINPGASVTFSGLAFGSGNQPMSSAVVGGTDVPDVEATVTNSYHTLD